MYEKELEKLGLTKGESKVYISLLKIGSNTVGPIIKESRVSSSNIYEILNRLIEKGLVSFIIKDKTKIYNANEPGRIKDYLEKKELEIKENKTSFEKLLPQLRAINNISQTKETTEIFIGEKGLLTAYEKLFMNSTAKDVGYFFYVHEKKNYERAEKFYMKSWKVLKTYKNKWKGISNIELKKTKLVREYPKLIDQKYVNFPVPGNIDIINDKVLVTVWSDKPIGILTESKEYANTLKRYFESVWIVAKN